MFSTLYGSVSDSPSSPLTVEGQLYLVIEYGDLNLNEMGDFLLNWGVLYGLAVHDTELSSEWRDSAQGLTENFLVLLLKCSN